MIFRRLCLRNTSATTRRDVTVCKTNNNSLFFSAMPILCTVSSHAISVKTFRWRIWEKNTRSDHVTRNALAARNNEAYGQGNGRESFCTVLRYLLLVIGSFNTRARNRLSVLDKPVYSHPLTHRHPLSDFFWGEGAAVHRVSETDNPSSKFVKIDG